MVFSILAFVIAAGILIHAIYGEVKWAKHKEEIRRQYKPGGADRIRESGLVLHFFLFVCFLLWGFFLLPL